MIPPFHLWDNPADPVTEGPAQWLSPSLLALEGFPISGGADCYKVIPWHHLQRPVWRLRVYHNHFLLFNVYFDIQNSIQILVGLKLGFSKVSKSHCNQLIKSSYIWWLQQWYSHLHTSSGGRELEQAAFLFTYSYMGSPWCLGPYHTSLERSL